MTPDEENAHYAQPENQEPAGPAWRWRWLESTRKLQEEFYGVDFSKSRDEDPAEFADAIVMNHSACVVELSEFMQEVGWKDWAQPRGWINREAALGELVDAAHFLANLLVRLDVTDDEWEIAYRRKQEVNRQRQRDGYDGVSTKCKSCSRALDDGNHYFMDGITHCGGCGVRLGDEYQ